MQNKQQKRKPLNNSKQPKRNPVIGELEKLLMKKINNSNKKVPKRKPLKNGANSQHPLMKTVQGLLSPFTAERGSFGGFLDPRPSQKFSGRGLMSVSIPANEEFMVMFCPCILSDSLYPSMVLSQGTVGNMALATSTFSSSTASTFPAGITQRYAVTSTPYNLSTLQTGQNKWRLLSAGARVRFTGPQLYRGGLVKFYHDTQGDIINDSSPSFDITTLTFGTLAERLDGHAGVIRHNLSDTPELQAVFPSITSISQQWSSSPQYWPANQEFNTKIFGGSASNYKLGQPIAYLYGTNTTGQALNFDCEMIEHWEIIGRNVDALNTPSTGSADLGNSLSTLVVAAHQHLAQNPSKSYGAALKHAVKDPHVRSAFSGIASSLVTTCVAML